MSISSLEWAKKGPNPMPGLCEIEDEEDIVTPELAEQERGVSTSRFPLPAHPISRGN